MRPTLQSSWIINGECTCALNLPWNCQGICPGSHRSLHKQFCFFFLAWNILNIYLIYPQIKSHWPPFKFHEPLNLSSANVIIIFSMPLNAAPDLLGARVRKNVLWRHCYYNLWQYREVYLHQEAWFDFKYLTRPLLFVSSHEYVFCVATKSPFLNLTLKRLLVFFFNVSHFCQAYVSPQVGFILICEKSQIRAQTA